MQPASNFIFLKDVLPGAMVEMTLADPELKQLTFFYKQKKVQISLHVKADITNIFYVCSVWSKYVVDDCGDVPSKDVYSAIADIVNDFFGEM